MKRLWVSCLVLVAVLGLSSCVIAGKATVIFRNKTTSTYLRFTMDGAPASANPIAAGSSCQWIGISPGDHTLGATAVDSSGTVVNPPTAFSETVNLPADLITTWSIRESAGALGH